MRPKNVRIPAAVRAAVDRALRPARERILRGRPAASEMADLFAAIEVQAKALGWDTPEVQQQIAQGRYRAPGFVVTDEEGYDRELARASVGPGWAALIAEVFDRRDRDFPSARIEQVKEKYGGLRIYFRASSEHRAGFNDLLDDIARRSYETCEVCGAPGVVRHGAWIVTRCDAHAEGRPKYPQADPEQEAGRNG
jgi:hypothetical protein